MKKDTLGLQFIDMHFFDGDRRSPDVASPGSMQYEQDPIDSIAYENDRIQVLYTTGLVEYYDYSIDDKRFEHEMGATIIPKYPFRLTEAISDGKVFGTICKVCGRHSHPLILRFML